MAVRRGALQLGLMALTVVVLVFVEIAAILWVAGQIGWWTLAILMTTTLLGVYLLQILPAAWLQLALALATGFYVLSSLRRDLPALPQGLPATLLLGLLAGVVGGATNAMSSILMMVLLAQSRDRNEIAQAANLCFALSKLVQLLVLWPVLQQLPLGWDMIGLLCLAAVIGLLAGLALRQRMAFGHFRLLCLLVLSVLALLMGWRGLQGLLG